MVIHQNTITSLRRCNDTSVHRRYDNKTIQNTTIQQYTQAKQQNCVIILLQQYNNTTGMRQYKNIIIRQYINT